MSDTANYNLYISDDLTEKFIDWRSKMNGMANSNMIKIDAALGQKADSSVAYNVTLLADSWVGEEAPFTQEVAVANLTASQNGTISVAHTATVAAREAARNAILVVVGQDDGSITIAADGEVPGCDIPVCIILLG